MRERDKREAILHQEMFFRSPPTSLGVVLQDQSHVLDGDKELSSEGRERSFASIEYLA